MLILPTPLSKLVVMAMTFSLCSYKLKWLKFQAKRSQLNYLAFSGTFALKIGKWCLLVYTLTVLNTKLYSK